MSATGCVAVVWGAAICEMVESACGTAAPPNAGADDTLLRITCDSRATDAGVEVVDTRRPVGVVADGMGVARAIAGARLPIVGAR